MTLILANALDQLLVQQSAHKHKAMIGPESVETRTGMDLLDLYARAQESLAHIVEWEQKELCEIQSKPRVAEFKIGSCRKARVLRQTPGVHLTLLRVR